MKKTIVHLDKEQTRQHRRRLLANDVYVLFHDNLEQLHKYGMTALSKVEVFVSAENFAKLLLSLPNIEVGIDDELDDLEKEAKGGGVRRHDHQRAGGMPHQSPERQPSRVCLAVCRRTHLSPMGRARASFVHVGSRRKGRGGTVDGGQEDRLAHVRTE